MGFAGCRCSDLNVLRNVWMNSALHCGETVCEGTWSNGGEIFFPNQRDIQVLFSWGRGQILFLFTSWIDSPQFLKPLHLPVLWAVWKISAFFFVPFMHLLLDKTHFGQNRLFKMCHVYHLCLTSCCGGQSKTWNVWWRQIFWDTLEHFHSSATFSLSQTSTHFTLQLIGCWSAAETERWETLKISVERKTAGKSHSRLTGSAGIKKPNVAVWSSAQRSSGGNYTSASCWRSVRCFDVCVCFAVVAS